MVDRDPEAIEYVLHAARENDVKFIRLWFTDILGSLRGFAITVDELESTLNRGMGFDGSSIEGFARSDEKDLYALPDPNTFSICPGDRVSMRLPVCSVTSSPPTSSISRVTPGSF